MPNIEWNAAFSVGSQMIDDQHKEWFEIYNTMRTNVIKHGANISDDMVAASIKAMRDYSRQHFEFEEQYMQEIGYLEKDDHVKKHKLFDEKMSNFYDTFEQSDIGLDKQMLDFVKMWLLNHVSNEDRKYYIFSQGG